MGKKTTWFFVALLAIVSALDAELVKTTFYINQLSQFATPFIRTKDRTITYSMELALPKSLNVPQYLSLDLEATSAVQILNDIMAACGHTFAVYNRMHYHIATSTLVYYCTENNTLLILDEESYDVNGFVPVDVQGATFDETKLYPEGDSVVILGMKSPFTNSSNATHLIKINLVSKGIERHSIFDGGLAADEFVTAYTSKDLLSFVLTSQQIGLQSFIKIYSAIFWGDNYKLVLLTNFTYGTQSWTHSNEFSILGNYLVTTNYRSCLVYSIEKGLVYTFYDIAFYKPNLLPHYYLAPAVGMQHGSADLYVQFTNRTVYKLSCDGQGGITSKFVINATEMHVALGNQGVQDLLFTVNSKTKAQLFNIIDSKTLQPIFTSPSYYGAAHLTESTYSGLYSDMLAVFDRKSNQPLAIIEMTGSSYFEEAGRVMYYINYTRGSSNCQLMYYSFETQVFGSVFSFYAKATCLYTVIVHAKYTRNISSPSISIRILDQYIIYSNQTQYNLPTGAPSSQLIVPDYGTLTIYAINYKGPYDNVTNVTKYEFNTEKSSFDLIDSYNLTSIPYTLFSNFAVLDSITLVALSTTKFTIIHLANGTIEEYPVSFMLTEISTFHDESGQVYLMIGRYDTPPCTPKHYIFGPDKVLSPLPEIDTLTSMAGSAGLCSYWILENYIYGFQVMKFYDICSSSSSSKFSLKGKLHINWINSF